MSQEATEAVQDLADVLDEEFIENHNVRMEVARNKPGDRSRKWGDGILTAGQIITVMTAVLTVVVGIPYTIFVSCKSPGHTADFAALIVLGLLCNIIVNLALFVVFGRAKRITPPGRVMK